MNIMVYANGPFMVNTYLVFDEATRKGFIVDPGSPDMGPLIEKMEQENITPEALICTHGHWDHVAGVGVLKKKYAIPFYINENEKPVIEAIPAQASMFGVEPVDVPPVDEYLPEYGELIIAGLHIKVCFTPGHSPGSVSLYVNNEAVFSGDALFNMSIGRTDLPGGNYSQLISSIKEKLFALPDDTKVFSGHGPETTIGAEKKINPFLR